MDVKNIGLIITCTILAVEATYVLRGFSVLKWRNECRAAINKYNENNSEWIMSGDVMKSMNEVYFKFWINGSFNMLKDDCKEFFEEYF